MPKSNEIFDAIVIGGGSAGMMAAIKAGQMGAKTLLLEKNETLGNKLLLTGGQRCNITKAEFDPKQFTKKYGKEGDFLLFALSVFGVKETIDFFNKSGLKTKIEKDNRVFPASNKSSDVLKVLIDSLAESKVLVRNNSKVASIIKGKSKILGIVLENDEKLVAKNYIICTGGVSFPGTGSTGDGYKWAKELGHTVEKAKPALVPIKVQESWVKTAQGLSLTDVELNILVDGKKKGKARGEIMFTHFGLSGPMVLDISSTIGRLMEKGKVELVLDLHPDLNSEELDKEMQTFLLENSKMMFINCLSELLSPKLAETVASLAAIPPGKKAGGVTKLERKKLVELFKNIKITPTSLFDVNEAIVTSGGVALKEINSKTMRSKIISNLFFAGEAINLNGPTGGYNLQLCWSTGYLAGQSVVW